MTLNEKIIILMNELKHSTYILLDGVICLYNDFYTYEKSIMEKIPESIYFDDADGDDFYKTISVNTIKDIECVNGKFKIIYNDEKYNFISILNVKICSFENQ